MKRAVAALLAGIMIFSLAGCGSSKADTAVTETTESTEEKTEETADTTEAVAETAPKYLPSPSQYPCAICAICAGVLPMRHRRPFVVAQ